MKSSWSLYLVFLAASYATALAFELVASKLDPLNKTFATANWLVFFLVWYGAIYSTTYLLLRTKPLWLIIVIWAVLGTLCEILLFHRVNLIVDPIVYGIMFFIPFKIYKTISSRN